LSEVHAGCPSHVTQGGGKTTVLHNSLPENSKQWALSQPVNKKYLDKQLLSQVKKNTGPLIQKLGQVH